ncbi:MAG: hypothetical protein Kow00107_07520 [Planctomycetota bacterium]
MTMGASRTTAVAALLALILVLSVVDSDAVPWFRRTLSPAELEEIKELTNRLRSPALNNIQKSVVLGQLAKYRHDNVLAVFVEILRNSSDLGLRIEASSAIGKVGSPSGIQPLLDSLNDKTSPTAVRIAAVCSIQKITDTVRRCRDASVLMALMKHKPSLTASVADYFSNIERGNFELGDVADCWIPLLQLLGSNEGYEKPLISAFSMSACPENIKVKLANILASCNCSMIREAERALIDEYPRARNNRLRISIIKALANIRAGRKLVLNIAAASEDTVIRRHALLSLRSYGGQNTIRELSVLLAEEDRDALDALAKLFASVLNTENFLEFCQTALSSRESTRTANACFVLRESARKWVDAAETELWLRAFEMSVPLLFRIMESDVLGETARREAWLALRELIPPDRRPLEEFEPEASVDKRRLQSARLREEVEEPEKKRAIEESIRAEGRADEKPEDSSVPESTKRPSSASRTEAPAATASPALPQKTALPPSPSPTTSSKPMPSFPPRSSAAPTPAPTLSRGPLPPTFTPRPTPTSTRPPKETPRSTPPQEPEPTGSWHHH